MIQADRRSNTPRWDEWLTRTRLSRSFPMGACFLNSREVSLKNYVFRTGLNWRFDWGKAPVAVMAKY